MGQLKIINCENIIQNRKRKKGLIWWFVRWFLWHFVHNHCHERFDWTRIVIEEYGIIQHIGHPVYGDSWEIPTLFECSKCGVQFKSRNLYGWEMIKKKIDGKKKEPDRSLDSVLTECSDW